MTEFYTFDKLHNLWHQTKARSLTAQKIQKMLKTGELKGHTLFASDRIMKVYEIMRPGLVGEKLSRRDDEVVIGDTQ